MIHDDTRRYRPIHGGRASVRRYVGPCIARPTIHDDTRRYRPIHGGHRGVLATKVGYFGVKPTKVPPVPEVVSCFMHSGQFPQGPKPEPAVVCSSLSCCPLFLLKPLEYIRPKRRQRRGKMWAKKLGDSVRHRLVARAAGTRKGQLHVGNTRAQVYEYMCTRIHTYIYIYIYNTLQRTRQHEHGRTRWLYEPPKHRTQIGPSTHGARTMLSRNSR